jgi:predicted dehydrogenase
MKSKYKVGIIGCGLMGCKRAKAIESSGNSELISVADVVSNRVQKLAGEYNCGFTGNWKDITRGDDVDIVIVSTTNDKLAEITIDAIKHGKHVLVEKPAARNLKELRKIINASDKNKNVTVKVGFNHRFHPAIEKAKDILKKENIGDIMFIRARYGHGGRLGYDTEWRLKEKISGGGEMLDQGSHIVDLSRYFMGDFKNAIGICRTFFWKTKVEDNCFAILETKKGQIAQLSASCTQWKNLFSMEIFAKRGQINIDGLGKSYGKETLTLYRMRPEMGPPDKYVYEWDEPDTSWEREYQNLLDSIQTNTMPNGNLLDAYASLKLIAQVYDWSGKNFP